MRLDAALIAILLGGCSTTIVPPQPAEERVPVAVVDHGRHASLILGLPDDEMVRYSYGDWDWYALGRTGPAEALAALFWPTQGALGRRRIPLPATATTVAARIPEVVEDSIWFDADPAAVRALVAHLDGVFAANRSTLVYSAPFDLEFVHHPKEYWILHNSNRRVAEWVEALGADTEGPAVLSRWTRRSPPR